MQPYNESMSIIDTAKLVTELEQEVEDWKKKYQDIENNDPKLKEARRIQSLNMKREEELDRREKKVRADNDEVSERLANAKGYEQEQRKIRDELDAEVENRAMLKILGYKEQMQREYDDRRELTQGLLRAKYAAREGWHKLVFIYCTLWVVIQTLTSEGLREDFISIGIWIKDYAFARVENIKSLAVGAASVTEKITNETVAGVLHWLLLGLVGILLIAVFFGIPAFIIWLAFNYVKDKTRYDRVNRWVSVNTALLLISCGYNDLFDLARLNLPLIWIGMQILTPIIRWAWEKLRDKRNRQ